MDSFNPLKKAFWDDVGCGILATIFIAGVLFFASIVLCIIWWILTHGLIGLAVLAVIVVVFYALNVIGKTAQRI